MWKLTLDWTFCFDKKALICPSQVSHSCRTNASLGAKYTDESKSPVSRFSRFKKALCFSHVISSNY